MLKYKLIKCVHFLDTLYIISNDWIILNNEFGRMWKKPLVAEFNVLSLHLFGRTEEKHEKSVWIVIVPSGIQTRQ
jgi:hypothetical protein